MKKLLLLFIAIMLFGIGKAQTIATIDPDHFEFESFQDFIDNDGITTTITWNDSENVTRVYVLIEEEDGHLEEMDFPYDVYSIDEHTANLHIYSPSKSGSTEKTAFTQQCYVVFDNQAEVPLTITYTNPKWFVDIWVYWYDLQGIAHDIEDAQVYIRETDSLYYTDNLGEVNTSLYTGEYTIDVYAQEFDTATFYISVDSSFDNNSFQFRLDKDDMYQDYVEVVETAPAQGETGVSPDPVIQVFFDREIIFHEGYLYDVTLVSDEGHQVDFDVYMPYGNAIGFMLQSSLQENTSYILTIPHYVIYDAYNHNDITLKDDFHLNFTTGEKFTGISATIAPDFFEFENELDDGVDTLTTTITWNDANSVERVYTGFYMDGRYMEHDFMFYIEPVDNETALLNIITIEEEQEEAVYYKADGSKESSFTYDCYVVFDVGDPAPFWVKFNNPLWYVDVWVHDINTWAGIPNAEIYIEEINETYYTDNWGDAGLDLPVGTFTLHVDAEGYFPTTYVVYVEGGHNHHIVEIGLEAIIFYSLYLDASPYNAGEVINNTGDSTFVRGDTVNLTAIPFEGYEFVNWRLDGAQISGQPTFDFIMPADDAVLVAHFVEEGTPIYEVSTTVEPQNYGYTIGQGSYEAGAEVSVLAMPNEGFIFDNWTGDNDLDTPVNPYTFTMPESNVNLTANFSEIINPTINPSYFEYVDFDHFEEDSVIETTVTWNDANQVTRVYVTFVVEEYGNYYEEEMDFYFHVEPIDDNTATLHIYPPHNKTTITQEGNSFELNGNVVFDIGQPAPFTMLFTNPKWEVDLWVHDMNTWDGVPYANIFIHETGNTLITNEWGSIYFDLPEGVYTLDITAEGFFPIMGYSLYVEPRLWGNIVDIPMQRSEDEKTFAVTFNVDMSEAHDFNPDADRVYITGDMIGWWPLPGDDPENQLMEYNLEYNLYTKTLMLPRGYYEYKYFINEGWDRGEWGEGPNRSVYVDNHMHLYDIWGWMEHDTMPLMGDVNNDGAVNVLDIIMMVNHILGREPAGFNEDVADITGDGQVNVQDVVALVNMILGVDYKSGTVDSKTAYIRLEEGTVNLESDGTLAALQFEILTDNASQTELSLIPENLQLSYRADGNVIRGMIYSLNNTAIPKGDIKLLQTNIDASSIKWNDLLAANVNAQSVDVVPKTTTSAQYQAFDNVRLKVYPNPSTGVFFAELQLVTDARVELSLFDVSGRMIKNMPQQQYQAGVHKIRFDQNDLSTGFYMLKVNVFDESKNTLLLGKEMKILIK